MQYDGCAGFPFVRKHVAAKRSPFCELTDDPCRVVAQSGLDVADGDPARRPYRESFGPDLHADRTPLRADEAVVDRFAVEHNPARIAAGSPPVKLSNARSEWGSCNRKGEIRLSWRLIQLPPELAQYVVAHEVAHLVELNHSPRFWALVETLYPGHAAARRALSAWSMLLE